MQKVGMALSDQCWPWRGSKDRYGFFCYQGKVVNAHRAAYTLLVGPIPPGLVVDHLCGNPLCVNPAHLEAVTQRENVRRSRNHVAEFMRQTHCKRGHPFDQVNTYFYGGRNCHLCRKQASRAAYWRNPEKYRAKARTKARERTRRRQMT